MMSPNASFWRTVTRLWRRIGASLHDRRFVVARLVRILGEQRL